MDPSSVPRPAPTRARRWPWAIAAATIAVFVLSSVAYPDARTDLAWAVMFSSIIVAFTVVGAVLTVRVPGNVIGPILLCSGALLATTVAIGTWGIVAAEQGGVSPSIIAAAALINEIGFIAPIIVVLIGVPLVFPDGHLLSPGWRWIVVLSVLAVIALSISFIFGPDPIGPTGDMPNPFAIPELEPLLGILQGFASWSSVIVFVAALVSVGLRYRRSNEIERHQLKWLIAVSGVAAVALPLANVLPESFAADVAFLVGLLALLALPIAIGVAILRYRLYEIDRLISRTIGWAVVSGLLVGAFAVLVVGLQALLSGVTQGDTLAVAASTLAAFALFQPVRRTVQRVVDRRFDRARYDAQRTVDTFAERLRSEVDLDVLASELERTVEGAIRPTAAAIWLPGRQS